MFTDCGSWFGVGFGQYLWLVDWSVGFGHICSTRLDNPSLRNLLCDDKLVAFDKTDLNHGQK